MKPQIILKENSCKRTILLTRYLIIKPLFPQGSMLLTKINNIQCYVPFIFGVKGPLESDVAPFV